MGLTQAKKRIRYTSRRDPRYLRLLESSRAWKRRNRNNPAYKKRKAKQDLSYYLSVRDSRKRRRKRIALQRAYLAKEEVRKKIGKIIRNFLRAHPERVRAYGKVNYAVKTGKLKKPRRCQSCHRRPTPRIDGRSRLQAHHKDYRKPLDVLWLCSYCHGALRRRHREPRQSR